MAIEAAIVGINGKEGIDFCSEESLKETYCFKFGASSKSCLRVNIYFLLSN